MRLVVLAALCLWLATIGLGQENVCDSFDACREALAANKRSSAAHFRMGELYFAYTNFQSAANEFREALNGDLEPKWTEVWSHVNLGKIFDATGQRDRAMNEYRQALRTKDNTRGALDEAMKYLQSPYKRE